MTWNWKFAIGDQVNFTDGNGTFVGIVQARVMTGGKVADTPVYSIKVQSWDGGAWLGHNITPLALEVEKQNS